MLLNGADVKVSHLEHPLTECQANACGQNQVVGLKPGERVAQEAVAVSDLPTKPSLEFGGGGGVGLKAVASGIRDVRKQAELLGDGGPIVDFRVKGFAEVHFAVLACNGSRGRRCGSSSDGPEVVLVVITAHE